METRFSFQGMVYAVAILVIFGVCCLGIYVALSGYSISNPPPIKSDLSRTFAPPATQISIVINTDTPAPTKPGATAVVTPSSIPFPTGIGALQTITFTQTAAALAPTIVPRPSAPTSSPQPKTTLLFIPPCGDFPFCATAGPADASLAPGGGPGSECPRNFIWGRIVDSNGKGIPERRVRFRNPDGILDSVVTKASPDPPGIYNIPTGQPGSNWTVWLSDAGAGQASQQVLITTQTYAGSGNCPTRIDFIQKR